MQDDRVVARVAKAVAALLADDAAFLETLNRIKRRLARSDEPAREKTPEESDAENCRAWKLLDRFCESANGKEVQHGRR